MNKIVCLLFSVILFLCLDSGCKSKHPKKQVITYSPIDVYLKVNLSPTTIEPDSLITVSYIWKTGKTFKAPEMNQKVYVHFSDRSGNILFQDDHILSESIVDWGVDEVISYKRFVYCPILNYSGEVLLFAGLYDPDNCLKRFEVLQYEDVGFGKVKKDYVRMKLNLQMLSKSSDELSTGRIRFKRGWYEAEVTENDSYRWSKGTVYLGLSNIGVDSILYIKGWSDPRFLQQKEQKITLSIGEWSDIAVSDPDGNIIKKFLIPGEAFCDQAFCELEIKLEQTFIPAETGMSKDYRTLGFMLREIYFGPE